MTFSTDSTHARFAPEKQTKDKKPRWYARLKTYKSNLRAKAVSDYHCLISTVLDVLDVLNGCRTVGYKWMGRLVMGTWDGIEVR